MAYAMVLINAAVLTPFILFVLGFSGRGWNWLQGAVLASMLAPTDAVAGALQSLLGTQPCWQVCYYCCLGPWQVCCAGLCWLQPTRQPTHYCTAQ